MAKWQGTPVPNGYVENVYFNTNLSIEEVQNELSRLDYVINEVLTGYFQTDVYMYPFFDSENHTYQIYALKFYGFNVICYDGQDGDLIPIFSDALLEGFINFTGWKETFEGYFTINDRALSVYLETENGKQNNLISSLFSITPFVEIKVNTSLNSFLTGIADAIRSKKGTTEPINASNFASEIASISGGGGAGAVIKTIGGWQGTAVPNTGYVENVYFNTNLSVEEVNALLDNITFVEGNEYFIANETGSKMIIGLNASFITEGAITGYIIAGMTDSGIIPIFNGSIEDLALEFFGVAFTEWYSDFNGVFEFNDTAIAGMEGMIFGSQNSELTSLLSSTPFVLKESESIVLEGEYQETTINVVENGKVDINTYIENKEIPLTINVKTPQPFGKIEITTTEETDVSNYATAQIYDYNLVAENIRKDKSVLGITGTLVEEFRLKTILKYSRSAAYLFANFEPNSVSNGISSWNEIISNEETSNVDNFEGMFKDSSATEFPLIDTQRGNYFNYMYYGCFSATEFPLINTQYGWQFNYMYSGCSGATKFPLIDTSKGSQFDYMYSGTKAIEYPLINTSKGTTFNSMYFGCTNMIKLPELDFQKGSYFNMLCRSCTNLQEAKINNTNLREANQMFFQCSSIKKIDLGYYEYDSGNQKNMFYGCYYLKALIIRAFNETDYSLYSGDVYWACYHMLGTTNDTYNPEGLKDGYVYVPRDMIEKLQAKNYWNKLQFRALEDYTVDGTTTGEFDDAKAGLV